MVAALIAVFYFFLIKPQSDKAKKEAAWREGLKPGDRLVTAGGIHVVFQSRNGAYAHVSAAPNLKLKVLLSSLSPVPEHKEARSRQAKEERSLPRE